MNLDERELPCDADRGPLYPFQQEPASIFPVEEDCKVLSKGSPQTLGVSHLILDGHYLYSSHDEEGIVIKWDLAANVLIAKAPAVHIPADYDREAIEKLSWRCYGKTILGMLLTPERNQLYVWASYANICVLNCGGATLVRTKIIHLDVGWGYYPRAEEEKEDDDDSDDDEEDDNDDSEDESSGNKNCFRPHANVVVMGSITAGLFAANKVLFVGINAMAATPPSLREDVAREELCEGNILLIDVSDGNATPQKLGTWNGHTFPILALAVNESHLFSIDGTTTHGVQNLLMWDLSSEYEIGHVLRRLRFNDLRRSAFGIPRRLRRTHRVSSIEGICLRGSRLFLTTDYGMDICVIKISNLSIEGYLPIDLPLCGYREDHFEGGMASFGSTLVPWNQSMRRTYVFHCCRVQETALNDTFHGARLS